MKLSIVIPSYNEEGTIKELIERVARVDLSSIEKEIIVVDDASHDRTPIILKELQSKPLKGTGRLEIVNHEVNLGKGASIRDGFKKATGDIVLIQDADLEYNPEEYGKLILPIIEGQADVVYGSRFKGDGPHRVFYVYHYFGNKILTLFSNICTGLNLSDMETCYKVFRREVIDSMKDKIESERFGIEPELTARVARGRWRVYEVGISYHGRTYSEGKKISWKDGLAAIWHIIYFNLLT